MANTKSRTPPSSARQIYGKVYEKNWTPYFAKVLVAGNKTTKYLPKYGENLHDERDMCMHHILVKCRNTNCSFYYAQAKKTDAKYAANVWTVIAPGMEYIWRNSAADIQMQAPVWIKHNMENWWENNGYAKRRYEEERHQLGALQGGVSENMEQLPRQVSSVGKTRFRINSWAASHKDKWRNVPKKSEEKIH